MKCCSKCRKLYYGSECSCELSTSTGLLNLLPIAERWVPCSVCNGSGEQEFNHDGSLGNCRYCGGTGGRYEKIY